MGRVLTNNISIAHAIETTLGVLPGSPTWFTDEPNTIGSFGAIPETVARSPISKLRQLRKGTIVDVENPTEFEADMTMSSVTDFVEAFLYSTAVNSDTIFTGADATALAFTVPAADASQAAKFIFTASGGYNSLIFSRGYATSGNNGLFELTADLGLAGTSLTVTGLTVETAPTNAEVALAGVRPEAGDLVLAVSSTVGTLTSNNGTPANALDFTVLGLTVGQRIHVGGLTSTNRSASSSSVESFGGARVTSIATNTLLLDKLDTALVAFDGTDTGVGGAEVQVDLLFGRFIRNVTVDDSDYLERSFQFEAAFPNLGTGGVTNYWYSFGNRANQMQLNNPLAEKATINFSFVGQNSDDITDTRKTNADSALDPIKTEAFNTASDFFRLGVLDVDETGLTSDFKDMTATFNNNASGEKVLGTLGNAFINNGNFEVNIETTALFTNPDVIARITDNTTVTAGWVQRNGDGAVSVDIPSATLGTDGLEFPVNESVRIGLTLTAFVDDTLETSIGVSLFPVYPSS